MDSLRERYCARCGRRMEYRKRWASNWAEVRYCSARCRRTRVSKIDRALEEAFITLLDTRASSSVCPSEVARAVRPGEWETLMEAARSAGRRLAAAGMVEWVQRGQRVDPSTARGTVRVRRGPRWGSRASAGVP